MAITLTPEQLEALRKKFEASDSVLGLPLDRDDGKDYDGSDYISYTYYKTNDYWQVWLECAKGFLSLRPNKQAIPTPLIEVNI